MRYHKSVSLVAIVLVFALWQDSVVGKKYDHQKKKSHSKEKPHTKYSAAGNFDFDAHLTKTFRTLSDEKISVYDDFLRPSDIYLLRLYVVSLGQWEHTLKDPNDGIKAETVDKDHITWKTRINFAKLEKTSVGQRLLAGVNHFLNASESKYHFYEAAFKLVRRGDIPLISTDASPEEKDITMVIQLVSKWKKNDYGDILFYDQDEEVAAAIHPRLARCIIFDASIPYIHKPPSIDYKFGQMFLTIKLTKSEEKVKEFHDQWKLKYSKRNAARNADFVTAHKSKEAPKLDISKYQTKKVETPDGKKIFVFDGLFKNEELEELRQSIKNARFYYDDSVDSGTDNVQWIAGFNIDSYTKSYFWQIQKQVAAYVSGKDQWYPYDVACNMIRSADHTQIHTDCADVADEWTFLLYLNPGWKSSYGGETAYTTNNSDISEFVTEVRPRYGRVVIFQGTIPHSARPPAHDFKGIRYSFAVKMANTEHQARVNRFMEDFRLYKGLIDGTLQSAKEAIRMRGRTRYEKSLINRLTTDEMEPELEQAQGNEEEEEGPPPGYKGERGPEGEGEEGYEGQEGEGEGMEQDREEMDPTRIYTHAYEFEENEGASKYVMKEFDTIVSNIKSADGKGEKLREPLKNFVDRLASMHVKTSDKIIRNL
ncbi:hypothetical protein TrispH2_007332 [Trichoplax sp. H2]|uniref:Prolyl 4-hydroxylase alpha subunit domain-containing protein n=1 Tax=Trichoplax adhaerens TaxID=10228 RepID=B3RZJ9_TRIAD|nr:hypothetical protein TRIADDRAFT_64015 [Trichoplax adhaerens]EDV24217.1 hypothetical protein TRIADDRAFT_64015 [Trichoplax adhaerens]RDD40496.1 hypothetical protein TrispH2_007332 [Trichoplax sp. H2]|eukprot:XP_002113743.1 hypothetical protein TRIADDRAFT_64015 [Trichoplax adhaerens]